MDQIKTQNAEYPSVVSLHVSECEREVIVVYMFLIEYGTPYRWEVKGQGGRG